MNMLVWDFLIYPVILFSFDSREFYITTKNKMDNLTFIDEEEIPLIQQDEDDYRTSDTSRINEASFMVPDATEATSTLRLRQEVTRR